MLHFLLCHFGRDIAGEDNNSIGSTIVLLKPGFYVIQTGRIQIFHGADGTPAIRVSFRKNPLQQTVFSFTVRRVVALTFFVLHHATLVIQLFLCDGTEQMPHAIRFHPQRKVNGGRRNILEVVGAVKPGGTVHIGGAYLFKGLEVFAVVVFRAVKHKVFKQVSEAGFTGFLIFRPHVVPNRDRDNGRFVIFMDQ